MKEGGGKNAVKEEEQDESGGRPPAGPTEDHNENTTKQPESNLSRCAACYNHKATMIARWGGHSESSSSAEDSGPEVDSESEAESSSSCSEEGLSDTLEDPSPGPGDTESEGKDGGVRQEATQRAPVVTSSSPIPHLTPLSLLPRPHTVVSTLHLQVLSQNDADAVHIVQQQLSGREEEQTGGGNGGRGVNSGTPPQPLQWQQTGLQWQPTLQQQHQLFYQQLAQHFCPLSAQGQRLPPPKHTLPVPHPPPLHTPLQAPHAPNTHLYAPTPPPCWCWYGMHLPSLHHGH